MISIKKQNILKEQAMNGAVEYAPQWLDHSSRRQLTFAWFLSNTGATQSEWRKKKFHELGLRLSF